MPPGTHATLRHPSHALDAVNALIAKVLTELREGLQHGHFELAVSCSRVSGYLQVIVKAGKCHRFLIPTEPTAK